MRKLDRNRESEWAEQGRLDKAATLAAYIRDNYDGPITDDVLQALPLQSYEWWGSTAKKAGLPHGPSPACVEATIGMLAQEMPLRSVR